MNILIELLPVLLPLIKECLDKDGRVNTFNNLKRPGPLVEFKLYRSLRKQGRSVSEARLQAASLIESLSKANDSDINALLDEANG